MSSTGLDVFDKTIQTTNIWLNEIMGELGPDRQVAWHVLSGVLRTVRDRLPLGLAAHLGAQLPLLIRGTYYDQWQPEAEPPRARSFEEFAERLGRELADTRPVNLRDATRVVFGVLQRHTTAGQVAKILDALPEDLRSLWQSSEAAERGSTAVPQRRAG
jgi:uncharacterized protein (DUF2267 family)